MPSNSSINITSSGIVKYDGAGTFSALSNPLDITNGGTGDTSLTSYAVICAGTTSTGVFQSIASVGSSNDILTSNGAGALPTFQTITPAKNICININTETGNPVASTTYFLVQDWPFDSFTSSNIQSRFFIPISGTITKAYGAITVQGTLSSSRNSTLAIRLNNTTDTNISTTLNLSSATVTFNNTALSISVSAGDYIEFKFIGSNWPKLPTTVSLSASILIT